MAISKKIRFEVFKRDNFTCQYCGNNPPNVILEIDHIKPKSKKGTDDINNLITSCFDCNRGKSNIELKRITNTINQNKDILEEKENQYIEYHKLLAKIEKRINKEINQVTTIYENYYPKFTLKESFKKSSVSRFIKELDVFEVCNAMEIACDRINKRSEDAIKYFCGICWNKINKKYGKKIY